MINPKDLCLGLAMAYVKHFLDQTLSIHVCFPSPTKEKLTIHVFLVQLLHVQLERGAPRRYHHKHYFENIIQLQLISN